MRPERPPRLAVRLLRAALPRRRRHELIGDLVEDWSARVRSGRRGTLWFWRQGAALALGYAGRRALGRRVRHGGGAFATLLDDLVQAVRHLRRDPRYAGLAILLLAAGIGAATALFSVVHSVLLAPLPYAGPDRLVQLYETHAESGVAAGPVSPGNFLDFQRARGLSAAAAGYTTDAALTDGDPVETVRVGQVTGDFFDVLGVEPLLGRTFELEDVTDAWVDNAGRFRGAPRVVLDERLWRTRFGGDRGLVGRTIGINGQRVVVIGVVPGSVGLPDPDVRAWVAWDVRAGYGAQGGDAPRNSRFVSAVARLAPGIDLESARHELGAMAATLAAEQPRTNAGWSATAGPLAQAVVGDAGRPLTLLGGAVALLLLGVCVNLAGMQVARGAARGPEIAMRTALGAGRARVVRQLLLENLVVAAVAGALGLMAGRVALGLALDRLPADLPRPIDPALHGPLAALALVLVALTGPCAGLLPALRAATADPAERLRFGARTSDATRRLSTRLLVVAEIGLAVALVAATGLLGRSFARLLAEDPGFDPAGVLTARVNLEAGVSADGASRVAFFDRLLADLRDDTEVLAAAGATFLPMTGIGPDFDRPYWRQGEPEPGGNAPRGWIRIVTPGFFESLRIELAAGRTFEETDRFRFGEEEPGGAVRVAIVNRTLAERAWPGESAVGRTLVMDYPRELFEYEVVGVIEDVRPYGPGAAPPAEIYLPYAQIPYPGLTLAIRTRGDPAAFAPRLRTTTAAINPLQPVDRIAPLTERVAATLARERFVLTLVGAFGAAALLLAAIGVYGLLDLLVYQRAREMGIRLALGARPADLRRSLLAGTLVLAAAGLVVGLGITVAGARWLAASLYRTSPLDPAALGATAAVIAGAALAAAWAPARRATRIEPTRALRGD